MYKKMESVNNKDALAIEMSSSCVLDLLLNKKRKI